MTRKLFNFSKAPAILFVLCAAALLATFGTAEAQRPGRSPYCAILSGDGGMDCSYPTLQSCLATVSGVGGTCNPNPRGPGGAAPPGFLQRLMQGNGPAFAPVDVGPPPDAGPTMQPDAGEPNGECLVGRSASSLPWQPLSNRGCLPTMPSIPWQVEY